MGPRPRSYKARIPRILIACVVLSVLFAISSARAATAPPLPATVAAKLQSRPAARIETTTYGLAYHLGGAMRLLPPGWVIHPDFSEGKSNYVQPVIDSVLRDILSTPTGSRFCAFLRDKAEIVHYIGLSSGAAENLPRRCRNRLGDEADPSPSVLGSTRLKVFPVPRTWIIVVAPEKGTHIDSYTNVSNISPLILTPGEINRRELIYRVAHELALSFDVKSTLDVNWFTTYSGGEIALSGALPESCSFLANANQLHMSFAAMSGRALKVEAQILREFPEHVGYTVPLQQIHRDMLDDSIECNEKATALAHASERFREYLPQYDTLGITRMALTLCPNESVFDRALARLSATQVRMGSGTEQNGCEMLLEPALGRWNTRTSHGPRPNLGCGVRCSSDGGGGSRTRGGDGD